MASEVEVLGVRLLRGFGEEALGNAETVVVSDDAALRAGFDPGSEDHEAALRYLLNSGYLNPGAAVGGDAYRITAAGLQRLAEG